MARYARAGCRAPQDGRQACREARSGAHEARAGGIRTQTASRCARKHAERVRRHCLPGAEIRAGRDVVIPCAK